MHVAGKPYYGKPLCAVFERLAERNIRWHGAVFGARSSLYRCAVSRQNRAGPQGAILRHLGNHSTINLLCLQKVAQQRRNQAATLRREAQVRIGRVATESIEHGTSEWIHVRVQQAGFQVITAAHLRTQAAARTRRLIDACE